MKSDLPFKISILPSIILDFQPSLTSIHNTEDKFESIVTRIKNSTLGWIPDIEVMVTIFCQSNSDERNFRPNSWIAGDRLYDRSFFFWSSFWALWSNFPKKISHEKYFFIPKIELKLVSEWVLLFVNFFLFLPDFATAVLAGRSLPALVTDTTAIDTGPVDTTVEVTGRIWRPGSVYGTP